MKLIVTGANGQLGKDVVRLAKQQGFEVYGFGREEMDVTSLEQVRKHVKTIKPDAIIHCAAYTKVDLAEEEIEQAYRVNAGGTRNVAVSGEEIGAKVCYISTDYVFDGTSSSPYQEYDRTNPLNVYGKSKLAGEELTKTLCSKYFIVRTSWVYGQEGHNFVKTMLRLAKERKEISVVDDQIGSPTYTVHLAGFLLQLVRSDYYGVYHASNTGSCSWYEFAKAIFQYANLDIAVKPIPTEQFPVKAKRPKFSVLNHIAIRTNGFDPLPHWQEGLKEFFMRNDESTRKILTS